MSKKDPRESAGEERDLEDLLVESFVGLRASPSQRRKFPALDRIVRRIEARERGLVEPQTPTWARLRSLTVPLTAAAAGFVGAALALAILPGAMAPRSDDSRPAAVEHTLSSEPSGGLNTSVQRLENAVHGLEKFQPLLESRIEWLEDALQRVHRNAYVAAEHKADSSSRPAAAPVRKDNGV